MNRTPWVSEADNASMLKAGSSVLIVSNRPSPGGVQIMLKFVIDCLLQRGCSITLAYYQPYSVTPELSVPLYKLASRTPGHIKDTFYGQKSLGMGCWLPELEVSHYFRTKSWRNLIESHDAHIVVSGSCLPAWCLLQSEKKFLAWVASDWRGDRQHRIKQLPMFRRILDFLVISPLARQIERRVIRSGNLLALSQPTQSTLNALAGDTYVTSTLAVPINTELFKLALEPARRFTLGFVGRFEDPRKNLTLLFDVLEKLVIEYPEVNLLLIGDEMSQHNQDSLNSRGIADRVEVVGHVEPEGLPAWLQKMDIFVLPSHQEGLCIALLEAMSCGLPVVSTRCGGPESFLVDGENGRLCGHTTEQLCGAISQLFSDEKLRMRYASAARKTIIEQFSVPALQSRILQEIDIKYAE